MTVVLGLVAAMACGGARPATPTAPPAAPTNPARAAAAQPACQFVHGFGEFKATVGGLVGECTENERSDPGTGDTLQRTTRGLLVWRKGDGLIAYTDGGRTWVRGPDGRVYTRGNNERFGFESAPPPNVPPPRVVQPVPFAIREDVAAQKPTGVTAENPPAGNPTAPPKSAVEAAQPAAPATAKRPAPTATSAPAPTQPAPAKAVTAPTPTAPAMLAATPGPQATPALSKAAAGSFEAGTKIVPTDVSPGTYRSAGAAGCYWARLRGLSGDVNDIIANENASGPSVVTIAASDKGFNSTRCGTWMPLGSAITASPTAPFGDGIYVVGLDVSPGTWRAPGSSGCYWARLNDLSGDVRSILANENSSGSAVAAIAPADKGFTTKRCGTWTKAG